MQINILAVAVATVSAMGVGALWYGPLLGRAWRSAAGLAPDHGPARPAVVYGGTLVSTVVTVVVLAALSWAVSTALGTGILPAAILTAAALWVGVAAARPLINVLFEAGSAKLYAINAGHDLVVLVVAAVIIGLFGN